MVCTKWRTNGRALAIMGSTDLVAGILRGRLKVGGLLLGVVLFVLSVVGTTVVTTLAWKLITAINPAYRVWTGRGYYGSDWHLLFLAALSAAFITAVYLLARRFIRAARDDEGVAAGALIVLALLAIITGTGMPSLSYLFTWPTLAGVLVLGFSVLTPERARRPWPRAVVLALTAFAPIILYVPPIYTFYTIQGAPRTVTSGSVPQVVAAFVVLGLMLGMLLPHLWFLGGRRRWTVPAAFAALALIFLVGELVTTRFNASHPRPDYVQYRLDADTHQANWISDTIPPDAWTEQFFELGYEKGSAALAPIYDYGREFEIIRGAAPEINLAAPRLKTLEDTTSEGVRTLRLRLVSARGAPYAHLQVDLPGAWVEARVNGEEIEASRVPVERRRRFALMFYNLPKEGVDVTLSVRSKDNIDATITDYSNGLPDVPGMEVEPRPPKIMPAFLDFRDPTVVYRSFEL